MFINSWLIRVKLACIENRTQAETVVSLTIVNATVWLVGHTLSIWGLLFALLMWPFFAGLMRITQPLQNQSVKPAQPKRVRPGMQGLKVMKNALPVELATASKQQNQVKRRPHPTKGAHHDDNLYKPQKHNAS